VYEESDVDAALARFEELHPQTRRPQNTASQAYQRSNAYFTAGDWDAMSKAMAQNVIDDDRRHIVNAGVRHGRDAMIANGQAVARVGANKITSAFIATRGERLALCRSSIFGRDEKPGAFRIEFFSVVEIDADEQLSAQVAFDLDDFDAAIVELEARYLAGEAAPYARAWSVVSGAYAAMNRHELFPTTPDWVNIDHRRPGIIEEGGLNASLLSLWELIPDVKFRVETVHRLSSLGAVCSHVARGISKDGFDAEWRGIEVLTVDGEVRRARFAGTATGKRGKQSGRAIPSIFCSPRLVRPRGNSRRQLFQ
jgi:hypothetical protein